MSYANDVLVETDWVAEHLDDDAYAQGVLKCVFVGVPLADVSGTLERTTPELAAMKSKPQGMSLQVGTPQALIPVVLLSAPATISSHVR